MADVFEISLYVTDLGIKVAVVKIWLHSRSNRPNHQEKMKNSPAQKIIRDAVA